MTNHFYGLVDVLVCDPVAANRPATRSALYTLGCRHIEIVADLSAFREALDQRHPYLALCEASVGETNYAS
jgi:hypothetical protein